MSMLQLMIHMMITANVWDPRRVLLVCLGFGVVRAFDRFFSNASENQM
jgi:hypothetical protein